MLTLQINLLSNLAFSSGKRVEKKDSHSRESFFVYFVLFDNRTCFSLESGECGIDGSDDCGASNA